MFITKFFTIYQGLTYTHDCGLENIVQEGSATFKTKMSRNSNSTIYNKYTGLGIYTTDGSTSSYGKVIENTFYWYSPFQDGQQ